VGSGVSIDLLRGGAHALLLRFTDFRFGSKGLPRLFVPHFPTLVGEYPTFVGGPPTKEGVD